MAARVSFSRFNTGRRIIVRIEEVKDMKTKFKKAVYRFEHRFDDRAERFIWRHPVLGFFCSILGGSMLVLGGVYGGTMLVVFPLAYCMGWL